MIATLEDKAGSVSKIAAAQVNIAGKWLAEVGFEVGTGVNLKVLNGCLVLIPDSREETRLRQEQARLEQQRRKIELARQQALALLAQAGG
ncbi:SymE family type I addiction module toxin [Erwinia tasmaniensis]|uniref:SymE family type I addiction module toxin n=1 Tax=Erwinia tasmaniensis TaxID=338565 RepID=UPI003A4DE0C0